MTETEQQREGRVDTEIFIQQMINEIEHEITQLYTIVIPSLRRIEEVRLKYKLDSAKKALEWVKGREG